MISIKLLNFNINKYQEQLKDAENSEDDQDETDSNTEEMVLPGTPAAAKKFRFKFPNFNRKETTKKIKDSLVGKSPINSFEKFSWNAIAQTTFDFYQKTISNFKKETI